MKKTYQSPVTEFHRVNTTALMAASPVSVDPDGGDNKFGDLDNYEGVGDGNLSKGGNIWDAWD